VRFLLVFLVVLVVAWRWRAWREARHRERHQAQVAKPATVVGMVACGDCGVHVPTGEAVTGSLGHYCSVAHRLNREP
jgi:uncharacterized protein